MPILRESVHKVTRAVVILVAAASLSCCESRYHHLESTVDSADLTGEWRLTRSSAKQLKWEGSAGYTDDRESFIALKSSGECTFHSYLSMEKGLRDLHGNWRLHHNFIEQGEEIPNVIQITLATGDKPRVENLFVARSHSKIALWTYYDNGWGDRVILAYQKRD